MDIGWHGLCRAQLHNAMTITDTRHQTMHDAVPTATEQRDLAEELRAAIRGEVRFDAGTRALYATDASNYRQVPIGVVVPRDLDDVVKAVAICHEHGAPILARGGGTSLAGQCCNVAVVLDMSKYLRRVLEVDPVHRLGRVEPGAVLDELQKAAAPHHLRFGPDPATHDHNTLGGMIGNNSCGVHSVIAGRTADNVEELQILTYDGLRMRVGRTTDTELEEIIRQGGRRGEIYAGLKKLRDRYADLIRARFPDIPRRVSGFNLDELLPEKGFNVARALVGSESTCVLVLEATLRLIEWPAARSLLVLGYPDIATAGDHVPEIRTHKPMAIEALDDKLADLAQHLGLHVNDIKVLPRGRGWLMVEFGGNDRREAEDRARKLMDALAKKPDAPEMKLFDNPRDEQRMWAVRESGLGATTFMPGTNKIAWPGWEDSAVPIDKLGDYLRGFREMLDRYQYDGSLYGHFGDGCVHTSTDFDMETRDGIRAFRSFVEEMADLVVRCGGSLSGEHGDGQARGELLEKMYGSELVQAFREFKAIWDPDGRMNPGKVVDPYPLDSNLRLGTSFAPPPYRTHFSFSHEGGGFTRAALRCVGIGECRKTDTGTMCPSYMVTHEEMHSTRGRARMLYEMLEGDPLTQGWRDEHVKEALDLCLSCKGCKGDCPVSVDMATYKSEFLSHYYARRIRPRQAYAFGLIMYWARLAALAPWLVNAVTQTPVLRNLAKLAAGVAPQRRIPRFATQTFKESFRTRAPRNVGKPEVILWADTFNNHFHPSTALAAVEVLEAAGFHVRVPEQSLCCGRPLYDYGFLNLAKYQLRRILSALRQEIQAGTPIVVLEPSCAAVFRDELTDLFPRDENAWRLQQQTFLLSEFLERSGWELPAVTRKALVHGHCHHKAVMKMDAEEAVLRKTGIDFNVLDSGCCGMAGGFGFESGEHYEVSVKAGERVLLPAVRNADKDTLIVADGFSCREQIAQTTKRQALHLAELLQLALHAGASQ